MLLQLPPMFLFYYLVGIILLLALSISVTLAARYAPKLGEEGRTGFLADWWKWINGPTPYESDSNILTPKYATDKQVESWLCPICGSKIAKHDVENLEYGYSIECKYCGATISSSRMCR